MVTRFLVTRIDGNGWHYVRIYGSRETAETFLLMMRTNLRKEGKSLVELKSGFRTNEPGCRAETMYSISEVESEV